MPTLTRPGMLPPPAPTVPGNPYQTNPQQPIIRPPGVPGSGRTWRWRHPESDRTRGLTRARRGEQTSRKARASLGLFLIRLNPSQQTPLNVLAGSPVESLIMSASPPVVRGGEYAARGDYHREPDPSWDYYPTYLAKLAAVRAWLDTLPRSMRVLDAGCGEGVLVSEYADRLAIEGVDAHYSSERVHPGSVTALPYGPGVFDRALCLDVLEHLTFEEQPVALAELQRVLRPGGELLVSVPNLAHLQSRVHFLLQGRLIRTASALKHPGDRPVAEVHPARTSAPGSSSSRARESFQPSLC